VIEGESGQRRASQIRVQDDSGCVNH